jgi:hypothetical protein
MKRFRGITIALLLVAAWLVAESLLHRRTIPPKGVIDIGSFLEWRKDTHRFVILADSKNKHLMATGPGGGLMPSGPAAYVFDDHGRLVDWSPDIGDDDAFDQRWNAQRARSSGSALPRDRVAAWLARTTRPGP